MDYSLFTSLTVNVLTFSVGSHMTWTSPVLGKYTGGTIDSPFNDKISEEEGSWISASFSLGAIIGPFVFGLLIDKIGRKFTLLVVGLCFSIGSSVMIFAKAVYLYYIGRFLLGLGSGGVFNIIPVYISEIANSNKRGMLSSMLNIFLCAGELFSYCVGPYVSVNVLNIILAIFPLVFLLSFFIVGPESAVYYLKIGEEDLAKRALQKVRGGYAEVESELNSLRKSIKETENGTFSDIFRTKQLKKALLISLGLMIFQQLSGIIALIFYAQSIFTQAGVDLDPEICAILIGLIQLIIGFITPFTIDTLGRKKLLLLSSTGTFISEGILGVYSFLKETEYDMKFEPVLPLICFIFYIITYNLGIGPLSWIIMGELFPPNIKSAAAMFSTFVSFTLSFLVAKYFQALVSVLGMGGTFLIFTGFCFISLPFCYFIVVETKGKSLQEIGELLSI